MVGYKRPQERVSTRHALLKDCSLSSAWEDEVNRRAGFEGVIPSSELSVSELRE